MRSSYVRTYVLDKSFVECLRINLYEGKFHTQGCTVMLIPAVWVYGRMASSSQIKYLIYWQDLSGGSYISASVAASKERW